MNAQWSNEHQPSGQYPYGPPPVGPTGRPNPHAQQTAWQTAPQAAQPPRPSRGRKVLSVIGAVFAALFVLGLIGNAVGGGNAPSAPSAAPSASLTPVTPAPAAPAPLPPSLVEQTEAAQAHSGPLDQITADGLYVVGEDIEPGTYVSTGARPGLIELCSATTRDGQASNSDVLDWVTAGANERVVIEITAEVGAFKTSGCAPWVRK